jgi:hypothetical protein
LEKSSISENIKPILLGNIEDEVYSNNKERENFFGTIESYEHIADRSVK